MLKALWNRSQFVFVVMMALLVASPAFAQAGGGGGFGGLFDLFTSNAIIKGLITAVLAIYTFLQVAERYQKIFEGSDIVKHVVVIGAWLALTVWWPDLLGLVLGMK